MFLSDLKFKSVMTINRSFLGATWKWKCKRLRKQAAWVLILVSLLISSLTLGNQLSFLVTSLILILISDSHVNIYLNYDLGTSPRMVSAHLQPLGGSWIINMFQIPVCLLIGHKNYLGLFRTPEML